MLYTDTYSSTLSISGTTATCKSKCTGYAGVTTRITITQTLQKKDSSGEWYSVTGWVKTVNNYVGSATNYSYNLSSGKYRLNSVFTVYAGSKYETVTMRKLYAERLGDSNAELKCYTKTHILICAYTRKMDKYGK